MLPPPPRPTRTGTLVPYPTLFRSARRDLRELTLWLRNEADVETAKRFVASVIACFDKIAESPSIGSLVPTANPLLFGVRKWKVPGFPSRLIFYRSRSEEHTSELQSLMRISYAVFCLTKKKNR